MIYLLLFLEKIIKLNIAGKIILAGGYKNTPMPVKYKKIIKDYLLNYV